MKADNEADAEEKLDNNMINDEERRLSLKFIKFIDYDLPLLILSLLGLIINKYFLSYVIFFTF